MRKLQAIAIMLVLLVIIAFSGCYKQHNQNNRSVECIKNSECIVTGCSSEICSNVPKASICIMKPEYYCLKYASCGCINNKCQWKLTKEYYKCMYNLTKRDK